MAELALNWGGQLMVGSQKDLRVAELVSLLSAQGTSGHNVIDS